jgi:hypothetical protein
VAGLRDDDKGATRRVLRPALLGRYVKSTSDPLLEEIVDGEKW